MRQWINLFESDLPMDDASRMARAKKLGFTYRAYHGTKAPTDFSAFEMERGQGNHSGYAPFFSDIKSEADGYGNVMEVLLRMRKTFVIPDTFGTLPEDVEATDEATYALVTGGELPKDAKRERAMHNHDAIEHAMDVHYREAGNYDRKQIWKKIYDRLIGAGYDSIIAKDVRADFVNGRHQRINMLDMSGIRLTSAAFDPAKANLPDLRG